MIHNHIKITIRQLWKHKLFSLFNILGLATSIAVCLLVIMIIKDQYGYDKFHKHGDRIYRIISGQAPPDQPIASANHATTSLALKDILESNYNLTESIVRIAPVDGLFKHQDNTYRSTNTGLAVDPEFFDIFSFDILEGENKEFLTAPNKIYLTKRFVEEHKKNDLSIGSFVEMPQYGTMQIAGIITDPPWRSHLYFDFLVSMSTLTKETNEDSWRFTDKWQNNNGYIYLLLSSQSTRSELDLAMAEQSRQFSEANQHGNRYQFEAQSLDDIMPSEDLANDLGTATPKIVLYFLICLATLIIATACFNYLNLFLARSYQRSKEIGVRKIIGASRYSITKQFVGEAMIISFISLILALGILELLIPALQNLHPFVTDIFLLERTPGIYIVFLVFTLLVGLITGIFPALILSKIKPVLALQERITDNVKNKFTIRKILIGSQFFIALLFILSVLIILKQRNHVLQADLGSNIKDLMSIQLPSDKSASPDPGVLIQQLQQIKGVDAITSSAIGILTGSNNVIIANVTGKDETIELGYNDVAANFRDFMQIKLVAGNDFPHVIGDNPGSFMLINKEAARQFGFSNPDDAVGQQITMADNQLFTITGVTHDFNHDNIWFQGVRPFALRQGGQYQNKIDIRLSINNMSQTIKEINNVWDSYAPGLEMNSYFLDARVYYLDNFFRMGSKIIGFVGILVILICCMGLLGMVTYSVEQKLKEICIRKVLGANTFSLNMHLAKSYLKIILIGSILATPIVIIIGNLWLNNFTLRTTISAPTLMLGLGIALTLALVTIISQTLKASLINPIKKLRND